MFAVVTEEVVQGEVDFEPNEDGISLFFQWRKHPNLHGFFESLYERKGGMEVFNCGARVKLSLNDLEALEKAVRAKLLPPTEGFFFGKSEGNRQERRIDLQFVKKARIAIKEGKTIYYTSWW